MLADIPNGPSPGDQTASMAARLVAQLHSAPMPRLKPVSTAGAISRGQEAPPLAFSTLPAQVRWTIYAVVGLVLMAIIYQTLVSS